MTSKTRHHDRLDELASTIRGLLGAPLDCERSMGDLSEIGDVSDGEDAPEMASARKEALMLTARLKRDQALIAYFEENERARASRCSVHEDSLYASCGECVAVMNARRTVRVA